MRIQHPNAVLAAVGIRVIEKCNAAAAKTDVTVGYAETCGNFFCLLCGVAFYYSAQIYLHSVRLAVYGNGFWRQINGVAVYLHFLEIKQLFESVYIFLLGQFIQLSVIFFLKVAVRVGKPRRQLP